MKVQNETQRLSAWSSGAAEPTLSRPNVKRYRKLVEAHMHSAKQTAPGIAIPVDQNSTFAATQGAWRFYGHEDVALPDLMRPLVEAARRGLVREDADAGETPYALAMFDWSKIDYKNHKAKEDVYQITHYSDVGYELASALIVDAETGRPIAPVDFQLTTADGTYTTKQDEPIASRQHLDQLDDMIAHVARLLLPVRNVVSIIDREAGAVEHFRAWDDAERLFVVRCQDRYVRWADAGDFATLSRTEPPLLAEHAKTLPELKLAEIGHRLLEMGRFKTTLDIQYHGRRAEREVAEAVIIVDRPARVRFNGKHKNIPGRPLTLRLVVSRVIDPKTKEELARWLLLTNVSGESSEDAEGVDAERIANWYYYRWDIESYYKLLKSSGLEMEHWQQRCGKAIACRLAVASMACVLVWRLLRDTSDEATELKTTLVRLSGRSVKRTRPHTAPALLAGLFVFLQSFEFLASIDFDMEQVKSLAANLFRLLDSG